MYKIVIKFLLIIFSIIAVDLKAIEVKDLYLVKKEVSGQGKSERWKATLSGFKEVLIRKSGSSSILDSYIVQKAYPNVNNYLLKFEYSSQIDNEVSSNYLVSLYFEPRLIDALIQESQFPLWGSNRPLTLLWLAIEEDSIRRIVSETNSHDSSILEQISTDSIRRGVPLILPLMDLEDELNVSISDVWGRFSSAVANASLRYSADSVLFGRIRYDSESWVGKFGYLNQDNQSTFELVEKTPELVISTLVDNAAELLCQKYCIVEESGLKDEVLIDISDISSFSDFKQAESYLNSLSSISKIELIKVDEQHSLFKVTLLGGLESVVEDIALSQKMLPVEPKQSESTNSDIENRKIELQNDIDSNSINNILNEDTEKGVDKVDNQPEEMKQLYYRWVG